MDQNSSISQVSAEEMEARRGSGGEPVAKVEEREEGGGAFEEVLRISQTPTVQDVPSTDNHLR